MRLREEVGHVIDRVHVGDGDFHRLDALADVVVTSVDVFRARVVLRVVGEVDPGAPRRAPPLLVNTSLRPQDSGTSRGTA